MQLFKTLLCGAAFITPLASPLPASEPAPAEREPIEIRFHTYPVVPASETGGLHYFPEPEGEARPVQVRAYSRSLHRQPYLGDPVFSLVVRDPESPGNWIVAAQAELPATIQEPLIFILPPGPAEKEAGHRFSLAVVEDSFAQTPVDTVTFFNFTNAPLAGVIGATETRLTPGKNGPYSLHGRLNESLVVGFAVRSGDNFRKVLQNRWTFRPGERNYVILAPPRRSGSYRIEALHLIDYESPTQ